MMRLLRLARIMVAAHEAEKIEQGDENRGRRHRNEPSVEAEAQRRKSQLFDLELKSGLKEKNKKNQRRRISLLL